MWVLGAGVEKPQGRWPHSCSLCEIKHVPTGKRAVRLTCGLGCPEACRACCRAWLKRSLVMGVPDCAPLEDSGEVPEEWPCRWSRGQPQPSAEQKRVARWSITPHPTHSESDLSHTKESPRASRARSIPALGPTHDSLGCSIPGCRELACESCSQGCWPRPGR